MSTAEDSKILKKYQLDYSLYLHSQTEYKLKTL